MNTNPTCLEQAMPAGNTKQQCGVLKSRTLSNQMPAICLPNTPAGQFHPLTPIKKIKKPTPLAMKPGLFTLIEYHNPSQSGNSVGCWKSLSRNSNG